MNQTTERERERERKVYTCELYSITYPLYYHITVRFRAFGRRFYAKRLTKSTFVEREAAIYHCGTYR